ncbi:MAG: hypothetical protein ACYTFQ_21855, partial [Planctomycetota bacterium]
PKCDKHKIEKSFDEGFYCPKCRAEPYIDTALRLQREGIAEMVKAYFEGDKSCYITGLYHRILAYMTRSGTRSGRRRKRCTTRRAGY